MKSLKNNWGILATIIVIIIMIKFLEKEPKTIIKTKYIPKVEVIKETIIDTLYKNVYVTKTKTIKGKDTIIYKDSTSKNTIPAKQYKAVVKTDSTRADLLVTTTGELLDVSGVITYNQKETTLKMIKPKSGLFGYIEVPINNSPRLGVGLDYVFRNKIITGVSVSQNTLNKNLYINAKIGIKLF